MAGKRLITADDLAEFPRYSFEQGKSAAFYYSEEPFSYLPHKRTIRISDRGTLTNLLTSYNGYTISTGVLSPEMHSGIVSIPFDSPERMRVGYIIHKERRPSLLLLSYIGKLKTIIKANPGITAYLAD